MCGIVGAVDLKARREFPGERLQAMCAAIAHRGPDDEQLWREPGLAMGVRRLSIVDLQGGRQPITNESGDVRVAFNGELFEYPELIRQLKSNGHRFKSRCDTEVWAHLYEDHGDGVLDHVKGQFAVSIWDSSRRRLLLARDRMGICPLYYTEVDGWLLWASEVKSLLASGLIQARPDPAAIDHLFCFLAAPSNRSYFAGVRALPAGHALQVRDGRARTVKYWDLDFPDAGDEDRSQTALQLTDELDERLRTSIRRRLRGDVPVVGYLSGGVDSSLILAMASKEAGRPVPAYTVGLVDANKNELAEAAATAEYLGSPLVPLPLELREMAETFPEVVTAAEGPLVDTVCSSLVRLAQRVHADGIKVALTGEGADEGLAGYMWFKWQRLSRLFPAWFMEPRHRRRKEGLLLHTADGGWDHAPYRAFAGVRTTQQVTAEVGAQSRKAFYSPEMWSQLAGYNPVDDLNLTNERMARWHPLNQVSYVAYRSLLGGLLMIGKGDRVAMNASVETRPPFLDEDVVELCTRIPPKLKLRWGTEKWILRRVAERYLPKNVAWRKKHMFNTGSFSSAFMHEARPAWVDELLSEESLRATGLFDPEAVHSMRKWLASPQKQDTTWFSNSLGLTVVVASQLWHHTFCGGGLCSHSSWTPPPIEASSPAVLSS